MDITDRRLAEEDMRVSEQRLHLLVESIQDYAILRLDHQHRIDSWNPAAQQMLGFNETEALGQEIAIIFTPEDRAGGVPEQELQTALAEGRAEDNRWHVRKDGSRFYAGGVIAPLIDSMGNLRGFVKVMRDLTQQKLAEEQLQEAHDILEERVEHRTRELAGANQRTQVEIAERQHLEVARAELLRRLVTAQEEERRRIARELHDQFGQQISALRLGLTTLADPAQRDQIDETLARLQAITAQLDQDVDRLALELRPTTLDDLGLQVALQQHVEEWSGHHNIAAEFQMTGSEQRPIPPEIEIVLYRVVQEALTNVLKHSDARHVSILLERRADQVRTIIEDDGRGFDPETVRQQNRLGLLGMQERVALVGGTVTIETTIGRGTSVFVHIPTPGKRMTMTATKLRIFLADDHAIIREGLALLIGTQPNMEVVGQAGDGHSTLQHVLECQPDVVVMDVSMPGMNGALVTAQLCQACPGIRIVALTRHGEVGYIRQMLQAGAQGYVLKQAAGADLLDAIRTVAAGGTYLDTILSDRIVHHFVRAQGQGSQMQDPDLSEREAEVVQLIARGYSNKEIATQLGISVKNRRHLQDTRDGETGTAQPRRPGALCPPARVARSRLTTISFN